MVASKKKKKRRSTPGFPWVVLHNRDWTVLLQNFSALAVNFFSALEIKDNSKFNKGQGRGGSNKGLSFEIKDGWQPYFDITSHKKAAFLQKFCSDNVQDIFLSSKNLTICFCKDKTFSSTCPCDNQHTFEWYGKSTLNVSSSY